MACRRGLSTRATLLTRWYHPSASHMIHQHDSSDDTQSPIQNGHRLLTNCFVQQQVRTSSRSGGIGTLFDKINYCASLSVASGIGSSFHRNMSMSSVVGNGSDNVDYTCDVSKAFMDNTVELIASQSPPINEVAVAAADSAFPVAALQYLIDGVHSFTGLNWWTAIAITTIIIRAATLPFLISHQRELTRQLNMLDPHWKNIEKLVLASNWDRRVLNDCAKQWNAIVKEHGVHHLAGFKGLLIHGPIFISFFFAIENMVDKVPSFKAGGALWFMDLTTRDSSYIFPFLLMASLSYSLSLSSSFLRSLESNREKVLLGDYITGGTKCFCRGFALIATPWTIVLSKAHFCFFITYNLFSLTYELALKLPEVRKFLLQYMESEQEAKQSPEPSRVSDRISSRSIHRQRLRTMQRQVMVHRKTNKKH